MFHCDETGADALPMRFAAAAILFSIIIVISVVALRDFSRDAQVARFSADLGTVEARASVIYQQGGARNISDPGDNIGTRETIRIDVPNAIEIVVFGSMPSQDKNIPLTISPYEGNIIYYTTYDGITTTITSSANYALLSDPDRPIIFTPGSYEVTIELVKNAKRTFITLY
ncbi:MAG: hypothetical protein K8R25_17270 [Methanosarcinales archaeon]|nr:hypothetical protein [Methanosarcinales archaeon]